MYISWYKTTGPVGFAFVFSRDCKKVFFEGSIMVSAKSSMIAQQQIGQFFKVGVSVCKNCLTGAHRK